MKIISCHPKYLYINSLNTHFTQVSQEVIEVELLWNFVKIGCTWETYILVKTANHVKWAIWDSVSWIIVCETHLLKHVDLTLLWFFPPDMLCYRHFPALEDFCLVICHVCNQVVTPQGILTHYGKTCLVLIIYLTCTLGYHKLSHRDTDQTSSYRGACQNNKIISVCPYRARKIQPPCKLILLHKWHRSNRRHKAFCYSAGQYNLKHTK